MTVPRVFLGGCGCVPFHGCWEVAPQTREHAEQRTHLGDIQWPSSMGSARRALEVRRVPLAGNDPNLCEGGKNHVLILLSTCADPAELSL